MLLHARRRGSQTLIPFATITRVEADGENWRVTCADGETEIVGDIDWRIATETTLQSSFPAAPGTYIIAAIDDGDGGLEVHRTAVIGWGVYADTALRPITLDAELEDKFFVRHPDGRIESNHSLDRWGNETAWFEEQRESR